VAGKSLLRRSVWILVLAGLLWLFFVFTGRALRKIALAQIAELTNTKVEAESVDFRLNGSVFIKGLVSRPCRGQEYDDAIFKAETVYARFGIGSLLLFRPRLKKITVKDFIFNAQHDLDTGQWNIAALQIKLPGDGSGGMPAVRLKRGVLEYSKVSKGRFNTIAAVPLDVVFEPAEGIPNGCVFSVTTAERSTFGRSILAGSWQPGTVIIAGSVSSADVPAFESALTVNVLAAELKYDGGSNYELKLKIKDLRSKERSTGATDAFDSAALGEKFRIFSALQRFFNRYRPWGQIDVDLEAGGNLRRLTASTLRGKVYCREVSICDRRFPYLVEKMTGCIDFTEKGVSLNNLSGWHGNVELLFNGWVENFGPQRQYQIQITSDNMVLDDDLYNALSTERKKLWSDFSPSGVAAINYCISRQSQTDRQEALAVKLLGAETTYRHLPYPLKNLTGMLLFDKKGVSICDVVSQSNNRKITINGKATVTGTDKPTYDISIKAEGVAVDSTLADSLPTEEGRFCRQIARTGLVCIENLTGQIWSQTETSKPAYQLLLHTMPFQLNDDLFTLVPVPLEKIVSELQPRGDANLVVDLNKSGVDNRFDYKVTVNCLGDSVNFKHFPYPLKDIAGKLTMTENSVVMDNVTAVVGDNVGITQKPSTIKVNGRIKLADNAFSSARFKLDANDIFFNERLCLALPEVARPCYAQLSPAGRFDVDFAELEISNTEANETNIDFGGEVEFKNCSFSTSPAITELNAKFKNIKGSYRTGHGLCDTGATLSAGGMRIKGKSLTALEARAINYDPAGESWLAKNLTADCYEGRVAGKFELKRSDDNVPQYLLQAVFHDIDLKRFLQDSEGDEVLLETAAKSEDILRDDHTTGRMSGSLGAAGRLGESFSRIGRCRLQVTDMRLGKLSPMAKLLYVLKMTEPTDFAFDRMLVDSYIKHDRLFFQKLDLSGQAVAFSGAGWMNLQDQNLDLVLMARGKRLATVQPSVLQSLSEGLGYGVVRMEIGGKLYDPEVTTRTLPVITESLQILGTEPVR